MKAPALLISVLLLGGTGAHADKVTRTVSSDGVPKISIRGDGTAKAATPSRQEQQPPAKEFQVYELDGGPQKAKPQEQPTIVVVPSPPPIAPNPAAYGYGYGYGFGYGPGFGYGYPGWWGFPGPVCPPNLPAGSQYRPVNYQNPPVNYQNRPVNYQNRPVNYQPGPQRPWR